MSVENVSAGEADLFVGREVLVGELLDALAPPRWLDSNKLRQDNHDLREHLDMAAANIQRLALENQQLRRQLEAATKVTRIGPAHGPRG